MEQPIPSKMTPPPTPPQIDEKKYAYLLEWLKFTMVLVREDYVGDSEQSIRNLFSKLGLYYKFIGTFIEFRKRQGKANSMSTIDMMDRIIERMSTEYKKRPKNESGIIVVGSPEYKSFFENSWKPMIRDLQKQYEKNEFLMSFLEVFGNLYNENIWFDLKQLQNFRTLFFEISKLDETVLNQLYETYCLRSYDYQRWYEHSFARGGGRKLTRRRKSNPKSKVKHNKRRSYKKSSYKRQRH
jgi:hypothetical protein